MNYQEAWDKMIAASAAQNYEEMGEHADALFNWMLKGGTTPVVNRFQIGRVCLMARAFAHEAFYGELYASDEKHQRRKEKRAKRLNVCPECYRPLPTAEHPPETPKSPPTSVVVEVIEPKRIAH